MNDMLKEYIEKKELELKIEKDAFLLKEGLFYKEYSDKGCISGEYKSYDSERQLFYKAIPIEISDEDYENILKYKKVGIDKDSNSSQNPIQILIQILRISSAVLVIFGIIFSFVVLSSGASKLTFLINCGAWLFAAISVYSYAAIIDLLFQINKKL